jgi:TPR repeat protein
MALGPEKLSEALFVQYQADDGTWIRKSRSSTDQRWTFGEKDSVSELKLAARLGDADAQRILGHRYRDADGVPRNQKRMAYWYRQAADQQDASAQYLVGNLYAEGKGVDRDPNEAVKWYSKAAANGHADALCELGVAYRDGKGIARDLNKASECFDLAFANGAHNVEFHRGVMYDQRNHPGDFKMAVCWYKEAAKKGSVEAQFNLGVLYTSCVRDPADSFRDTRDPKQAVRWFRRAFTNGYIEAGYALGTRYLEGKGLPCNRQKAIEWLERAAESGSTQARERLDALYGHAEAQIKSSQLHCAYDQATEKG